MTRTTLAQDTTRDTPLVHRRPTAPTPVPTEDSAQDRLGAQGVFESGAVDAQQDDAWTWLALAVEGMLRPQFGQTQSADPAGSTVVSVMSDPTVAGAGPGAVTMRPDAADRPRPETPQADDTGLTTAAPDAPEGEIVAAPDAAAPRDSDLPETDIGPDGEPAAASPSARPAPPPPTDGPPPGSARAITLRWSGAVRQRTAAIPQPQLPPEQEQAARLLAIGAAGRERSEDVQRTATGEALSQVAAAPQSDEPAPAPPPGNPVPRHTTRILGLSDRRLPDQPARGLQRSIPVEVEGLTIGNALPRLTDVPVRSDLFNLLTSTSDIAALAGDTETGSTEARDMEATLRSLTMTEDQAVLQAAALEQMGRGPALVTPDSGPRQPVPLPAEDRAPVGQVVARLLAQEQDTVAGILDNLRVLTFPDGILKTKFPNIGDSMAADLTTSVHAELQDVAAAANITGAELDQTIRDRQSDLAAMGEAAMADVAATRATAVDDANASGQAALDAVAGAADAASEETLRRQESASGGVDPQVVNRRRDRTVTWIHGHVTDQITAYQQAGDRRLSQLRDAKGQQTNGYDALAQRESYQVLRPSGERPARDPANIARETVLATAVTQIRAGAREQTTAVTNHFDRDIRVARETTLSQRSSIETAGSAGIEATRQWAEDRILEGESWWTRFWTRVQRWFEEAEDVNEQWRVRRTTELRDAVGRDLAVADRVGEALASGVSERQILESQAIGEDQRFVIAHFFALGEGRHPLDYAALSMKFQLAQSHRPHAREVFERDLVATPISGVDDPVIDDLVAVTSSEGGGFDPHAITEGLRRAMRGWGTDEAAIYRSLANLSALQGHVVRKVYRVRYNSDLDSDLDSELNGDEMRRAEQLLAGEQARADATALHYAIAGMGTDEAAIMATLRSKSPEEIAAIRAAYLEQFGETLDAALEGDLASGHEIDQANALLDCDGPLANAIAVDGAMRGGLFGWGASSEEIEAVHTRIRAESLALAERNDWDSDQLEAEVRRRLDEVDDRFETKYGDAEEYNTPGLEGDTAMRRAFRSEFHGEELDLVNALADNDPIAADAARIEIERRSFYASDDRIVTVLQNQYERSIEAVRLDQGPARRAYVQREYHRRVAALEGPDATDPNVHSRIRMELERDIEGAMEREAVSRSRVSMGELETLYGDRYIWPLSFVVDWNTSGDTNRRAVALFEAGGRLDPMREIELASAEGDGASALSRLSTMTQPQIAEMERDWNRAHRNGPTFRSMLESGFSGRDHSDIMDVYEHGRPTDALETIAREQRRVRRETEELTGVFGHAAASDEAAWMRAELARLEAMETQLRAPVADTEDGRERSLEILADVNRRAGYVQAAAEDYRHQIDSVTNVVSQAIGVAIALVVAVVVTALTLGTGVGAGVAIAAAIIGSVLATAATVATKQLIKGGAYGRHELTTDLVVGAVDLVVSVATMGIGSRLLGPVLRGAQGAAGLVRAAASGSGKLIGGAASRLAATGAGRAIGGAASRLAGSGFGQAARSGITGVGRSFAGAGRGIARGAGRLGSGASDVGSSIAARGKSALSAVGRASPSARSFGAAARELALETAERVPTSRSALLGAAKSTLGEGMEDAIGAVPSAMVGMAMSNEAWKGDPLDNFAAGAWDAILQGVVMGRVMAGTIHMATPAIRAARTPFMGNVAKVGEVSSYLNARYEPFSQRNPGASMADFMAHPEGRAVYAEIRRRGLLDSLVALSQAGPPRAGTIDNGGLAGPRSAAEARADVLAETVPPSMREGTFVTADPALTGRSVVVQPLRIDGRIVGVDIRVGPDASALDIALHLPTVRTMRRYRGLLGQIRSALDSAAITITGQGNREGRLGWEAQAELEKLPAVVAARMDEIAGGRLTPEAEARVLREIDGLVDQIATHSEVLSDPLLRQMEGEGAVAARDEGDARRRFEPAPTEDLRRHLGDLREGAFSRRKQRDLAHIEALFHNRSRYDEFGRAIIMTPQQRLDAIREVLDPLEFAYWQRLESADAYLAGLMSSIRQRADPASTVDLPPETIARIQEIRALLDAMVNDRLFGINALGEFHRPDARAVIRGRTAPVDALLDSALQSLRLADLRRQARHASTTELQQAIVLHRSRSDVPDRAPEGTGVVGAARLHVKGEDGDLAPAGGVITGASPAARHADMDAPDQFTPQLLSGGDIMHGEFIRHAEQMLMQDATARLEASFQDRPQAEIEGELRMHVEQVPCVVCLGGLEGRGRGDGPLKLFSMIYPEIKIVITYDVPGAGTETIVIQAGRILNTDGG